MTGRMWVRTVDEIVQYTPEEGGRHGSHRAHGETA
jgi:hypothetical protein